MWVTQIWGGRRWPQWFYKVADREIGPLAAPQLKAMAQRGNLRPEDLVRLGTDGRWVPAERVQGLFPQPGSPPAKGGKPAQAGSASVGRGQAAECRGSAAAGYAETTEPAAGQVRSTRPLGPFG